MNEIYICISLRSHWHRFVSVFGHSFSPHLLLLSLPPHIRLPCHFLTLQGAWYLSLWSTSCILRDKLVVFSSDILCFAPSQNISIEPNGENELKVADIFFHCHRDYLSLTFSSSLSLTIYLCWTTVRVCLIPLEWLHTSSAHHYGLIQAVCHSIR